MQVVQLTKNKISFVDDEDFEYVSKFKWQCSSSGYAIRQLPLNGGRQMNNSMHREIMNPPGHLVIDHINRNKLDNQKANLRICTMSQNIMNQSKKSHEPTSLFKGVSLDKRFNTYRSSINVSGKFIWLGGFKVEEEAARAYDKAALEYFGEYAFINFPLAVK